MAYIVRVRTVISKWFLRPCKIQDERFCKRFWTEFGNLGVCVSACICDVHIHTFTETYEKFVI